MTAAQYVDNLLRQKWQSSITGRPHDVGKIGTDLGNGEHIKVVYESDQDWRQMDLANYDYLTITDGGISNMEAQSFGWRQEDVTSRVDIDIRTRGWSKEGRPGRIALYGERGAGGLGENESPRWGGLVGETLRALKSVRRGDHEYSLVNATEANDLSGQMGGQVWRAVVSVQLEQRSRTINALPGGGYGDGYGNDYGQ